MLNVFLGNEKLNHVNQNSFNKSIWFKIMRPENMLEQADLNDLLESLVIEMALGISTALVLLLGP